MSYFSIAWQWLISAQQWHGPDGIPVRLAQHLAYTGIALGIAVVIALPAGLAMGHLRRGGFAWSRWPTSAARCPPSACWC